MAVGEGEDTEGESVLIGDDEPTNLLTEGNFKASQKPHD
jgi:hypothetical protein